MPITIKKALSDSKIFLKQELPHSIPQNNLDAEYCLMEVLKKSRVFLHLSSETEISDLEFNQYNEMLKQRSLGRPLAQILGFQSFFKNKFLVDKNVLVPRPETETLVPEIIKKGDEIYKRNGTVTIIDAGAGTGCIGISLAIERKNWNIFLIENSLKALNILTLNCKSFGLKNCKIIYSDWLSSIRNDTADILVSNPPYIDKLDNNIDENVRRFEPGSSLFANDNGLSEIKKIIIESRRVIKKTGLLFLENGYNQSENITLMLKKNYYKDIKTILDYNGIDRFTMSQNS
ncbi:MAG: peptide chain release factor N(5)-glutamine methyltransferase [Pseudomonadota bacterium]|nr:peptide chain release factor N(5)-glutamine methyltransferase [Pseudomonadota bacterium]